MNTVLIILGYLFGSNQKKRHDFSHLDKPILYKDTRYWAHDQQTEYQLYKEYHKRK